MIAVGVAACWTDLDAAQRLVEQLSTDDIAARLICAGAAAGDDGACDVVVALWSPAAMTSLWVRRAAAQAAEAGCLVEASLTADARPTRTALAPVRVDPTPAAANRIAERIRRCAQGRPQGRPLVEAAGPALLAAAVVAAVAGPLFWLANQDQIADQLAEQSDSETMAEAPLPPPTPRDAPADPEPAGNGQGGPLIEKGN